MSMRRLFLAAVFAALPWMPMSEPTGTLPLPAVAVAADEVAPAVPNLPNPNIDVDVNRTERHVISFANPVVLLIGVGALVVIIALIAMASRGGGGTTIIKER